MLKGIAASAGVSCAKAYKLVQPVVVIEKRTDADPAAEIEKLDAALRKTVSDIEGVKARAAKRLSDEELAVFDAHLMMANDPELSGQMKTMIQNDKVNAEYAADVVSKI